MAAGPLRTGGSWIVQGCLFGAVALFAVLLIALVILAYARFREATLEAPADAPTGPISRYEWILEPVYTYLPDRAVRPADAKVVEFMSTVKT